MVESWVREALVHLNPEIAGQPDRADEVIYALRAILLSVPADGVVRANENFMAWLRGEKTMPFGPNGQHVTVRLVDADMPTNNRLQGATVLIISVPAVPMSSRGSPVGEVGAEDGTDHSQTLHELARLQCFLCVASFKTTTA